MVKVVDKLGTSINVSVEYLNLPHKCKTCREFGHSELRCPDRLTKPLSQTSEKNPQANYGKAREFHASPSAAKSKSHVASDREATPRPISPRNGSVNVAVSTGKDSTGKSLRRSSSLPSPRFSSSSAAKGSKEWIPVINRCSPPKRNLSNVSSSSVTRSVTSAQFDSEEELISTAQQIIRNRLAANAADIPPFAKMNEKRHFRRNQRQTYLKLCTFDDDDPDPPLRFRLSGPSNIPFVGSVETTPESSQTSRA